MKKLYYVQYIFKYNYILIDKITYFKGYSLLLLLVEKKDLFLYSA